MSGVALIHHSYGPYHVARAQRLRSVLQMPLHLLELAPQEALRAWDRPANIEIRSAVQKTLEDAKDGEVSRGVRALLDEFRPEVVVVAGYAHAGMRAAAQWARANKAGAVLLSDSHFADKRRLRLKEAAKKLFIGAHFQAAFTSGALSATYLHSLGVAADRIWRGYDVVDNEHFARSADYARSVAEQTRTSLKLPARFFLYVGRFAPEKNLTALLSAYERHSASFGEQASHLVLAGSGPEEGALSKAVALRRLESKVHLPGFFQQRDLGLVYGLARALLLPSSIEPWGLVVNEAMAAGLPVVVSTRCGCALDLVFPGVNGLLIEPGDVAGLARAMATLDGDEATCRRMGEEGQRIIAPWSLDRWALALDDCVRAVRTR